MKIANQGVHTSVARITFLFSAALFLYAPQHVLAQSVNYVDESGNIHFADSADQVPGRYRSQVVPPEPGIKTEEEYKDAQREFKRQQKELKRDQKAAQRQQHKANKIKEKEIERKREEEEKTLKKKAQALERVSKLPTPAPKHPTRGDVEPIRVN